MIELKARRGLNRILSVASFETEQQKGGGNRDLERQLCFLV